MKVVLLAGGLGTRLREETEFRPKPMVDIGGRPMLWHLMKFFATYGLTDFVVCAGYKGEQIKQYFLNYGALANDFTVSLGRPDELVGSHQESEWTVTVADTGASTLTAGRVARVQRHIGDERFMVTYGDGLSDLDIPALLAFHTGHGRSATVTTVRPASRFGLVDTDEHGIVTDFREKPQSDGWVDLQDGDDKMLEHEPLTALASRRQLAAFRHDGFWQPMDTSREHVLLNGLWDAGDAPWAIWQQPADLPRAIRRARPDVLDQPRDLSLIVP